MHPPEAELLRHTVHPPAPPVNDAARLEATSTGVQELYPEADLSRAPLPQPPLDRVLAEFARPQRPPLQLADLVRAEDRNRHGHAQRDAQDEQDVRGMTTHHGAVR